LFQRKKTIILLSIILIQSFLQVSLLFITVNLYINYNKTKNLIEKVFTLFQENFEKIYLILLEQGKGFLNFYYDIEKLFTNRELAIGFWLIVIIFYVLWKMDKGSLINLVKIIFNKKILILLISLILYFVILISILRYTGFWETRLWKIALIWFVFVGISLSFRAICDRQVERHSFC